MVKCQLQTLRIFRTLSSLAIFVSSYYVEFTSQKYLGLYFESILRIKKLRRGKEESIEIVKSLAQEHSFGLKVQ